MTPLDRIKKSHVAIMRHKKFCAYSGLLACGSVEIDPSVPTACTDGWNVKYGPDFVKSLTDPELRLLVLHEATHKAYRHLVVWKELHEENPRLANIAADHFVNLALVETDAGEGFIKMPEKGIQPEPCFHGMSVKQIYDALKQEDDGDGGDGGDGGDEGGDEGSGVDSHDWKGAASGDPKEAEKHGEEIQRAMRQGEILRKKLQGKGSGSANGVFGELLTPKVDWRKVLRDFVTELCSGRDEASWRKPNRRYLVDDIYMPSMQGVTMQDLLIGFDTSGSCFGGAEMTRFVTEIATIIEQVKPAKVHVAYVDTHVAGFQTFEDGQFAVQNLKPKGGGGTHLPVLFDYCAKNHINPTACVFFTDGYTDWGCAPSFPILWAVSTNIKAPYGTTIRIEV